MRSEIDQYIIDKVRDVRKKLKISQATIAYELGFESKAYIGAIESMNPARSECYNCKHLNDLARLFKCSPQDFWPEKAL